MPKIDFCFSGWVRGVEVESVLEVATGNMVVIGENVTSEEVVAKLLSGEWAVSLAASLKECEDDNIELFDYEASK